MAYCTIADLVNEIPESKLIELTDDADSGAVNTATAQWAIDQAAADIDSYINTVVELPLTVTPTLLVGLNATLAVCALFKRVDTETPETWVEACQMARETLAELRDGDRRLELGQSSTSPRAMTVAARDQIFTATELAKF